MLCIFGSGGNGNDPDTVLVAKHGGYVHANQFNAKEFRINNTTVINNLRDATFNNLSKSSGSFCIEHPLPSKTETHKLYHSFIEGPRADNIYRGRVDLIGGTASVNLDTHFNLTPGTILALNTNLQCFTTNESDWDPVKGEISGNVLTINSKNATSSASVSWMVIGERHDPHMLETDWTDANGRVVCERLKNPAGDNHES